MPVHVVGHMLVIGTTRSGKTVYVNELHRNFPRISILIDTKGIDSAKGELWGMVVQNLDHLPVALQRGKKIVWVPPRSGDGVDWGRAMPQLRRFWARVQAVAKKANIEERQPYVQLVVDEADQWEGFYSLPDGRRRRHPAVLQDMVRRGLGMGLRVVYVTQHPAAIDSHTRSELKIRIVFALEDESTRVLQQWNWDLNVVQSATSVPHGFASYCRELDPPWMAHRPRPRPRGRT